MRRRSQGAQSGFSLVELTIAAAIFSTGLGAFSLLLLLSVQGTAESSLRTLAVQQARALSDSIMLVPGALSGFQEPAPGSTCPTGNECAPSDMASSSFLAWHRKLARELPGGSGLVCRDGTPEDGTAANPACDGGGSLVVKVFWTEPGDDGSPRGRRTVSRLPLL